MEIAIMRVMDRYCRRRNRMRSGSRARVGRVSEAGRVT